MSFRVGNWGGLERERREKREKGRRKKGQKREIK